MGFDDLVHDSIPVNQPCAGLDAQYDWHIRRSGTRASDGVTFMVHEAFSFDVDAQIQHVYNLQAWSAEGDLVSTRLRRHRLRWWSPEQLEDRLRACGYVDVRSHGEPSGFITVGRAE